MRAWWLIGFGVWTGLALLMVLQGAMAFTYRHIPFSWTSVIQGRLFDWYTCAIFIPALVWLARRFPIGGVHLGRNVLVQLASTVVFVVMKYALVLPIARYKSPDGPQMTLAGLLAMNAIVELTILWGAIAAIRAIDVYLQLRRQERASLVLSEQLASARLSTLSAQIRPHFLFNTLNSIAALIRSNPPGAERMVLQLADLLNASLHQHRANEIALSEELRVLDQYLAIMQVRFGQRLRIEQDVADDTRHLLVPTLFLQPLVENALEHGIAERPGPGLLRVRASREQDRLRVSITDDGPGLDLEHANGAGIGLANTRARLDALYGNAATLVVGAPKEGGTIVTITLPAHDA
jgi:hypothetical protein